MPSGKVRSRTHPAFIRALRKCQTVLWNLCWNPQTHACCYCAISLAHLVMLQSILICGHFSLILTSLPSSSVITFELCGNIDNLRPIVYAWASQVALLVKNMLTIAGDRRGVGSLPGSGRFPGEGNGNPVQYSSLENSMGRGGIQSTGSQSVRHDWATGGKHAHIMHAYLIAHNLAVHMLYLPN